MLIFIFSVKDFSGPTAPRNLYFCTYVVYDTCVVGQEVGVVGPSLSELFPFVILAIEIYFFLNNFRNFRLILIQFILSMFPQNKNVSLMAMAGGIREHVLTS